MRIELRHGLWQNVLADVQQVDAVITDPPYSERTVRGQRGCRNSDWLGSIHQSGITYGFLSRADVDALVNFWAPRTRRWFVMFGDHITVRWALEAFDRLDWYHFPPVPWVKEGAAPRIAADGPSPQSEQIAIARPRRRMVKPELRFRRGWYRTTARSGVKGFIGAKPVGLIEQLITDYSEPGDLIVDPFVGSGTSLIGAHAMGRRAIGSERDLETYRRAVDRIGAALAAKQQRGV